jgi:hypothetical protein
MGFVVNAYTFFIIIIIILICVNRIIIFIIIILTHIPNTRQRLGKHIPEVTLSTIEREPFLGNGPINTHS